MNYKTHSISGLGMGLIASKYLIQLNTINTSELILLSSIVTASSILGSLFPDIDKNNSFVGNRAKIISSPIQFIFSHRGLFHSPIFNLILLVFFNLGLSRFNINPSFRHIIVFGFGIGLFSHLLLDMFNKKGIPLFLPFKNKHYRIIGFKMGGILELLFNVAVIIFFIIILIM